MNLPAKHKAVEAEKVSTIRAAILRRDREQAWRRIMKKFPEQREKLEPIMRHDLRQLEPWPDWVISLAAGLAAVQFPKIPKETFISVYQFFHSLIFGLPVKAMPTAEDFEKIPECISFFVGHLEAHTEKKFAEAEAKLGNLPELANLRREHQENTARKVGEMFTILARANLPPGAVAEKIADARRATFGKAGIPRNTTLATELYQVIFDHWPDVEKMSGAKELTSFLWPHLGEGTTDQKFERVKKLSGRLEILYQG